MTFATSQECWTNAIGNDTAPSTDTLPSLLSIDSYRSRAYNKIYKIIKTAVDSNGMAKEAELYLTKILILDVVNKTNTYFELPDQMVTDLCMEFSVGPAMGAYRPNDDGAIRG
jgi:hypothetical protein